MTISQGHWFKLHWLVCFHHGIRCISFYSPRAKESPKSIHFLIILVGPSRRKTIARWGNLMYRFLMLFYNILNFRVSGSCRSAKLSNIFWKAWLGVIRISGQIQKLRHMAIKGTMIAPDNFGSQPTTLALSTRPMF